MCVHRISTHFQSNREITDDAWTNHMVLFRQVDEYRNLPPTPGFRCSGKTGEILLTLRESAANCWYRGSNVGEWCTSINTRESGICRPKAIPRSACNPRQSRWVFYSHVGGLYILIHVQKSTLPLTPCCQPTEHCQHFLLQRTLVEAGSGMYMM